jgi:hypothetical protein
MYVKCYSRYFDVWIRGVTDTNERHEQQLYIFLISITVQNCVSHFAQISDTRMAAMLILWVVQMRNGL